MLVVSGLSRPVHDDQRRARGARRETGVKDQQHQRRERRCDESKSMHMAIDCDEECPATGDPSEYGPRPMS